MLHWQRDFVVDGDTIAGDGRETGGTLRGRMSIKRIQRADGARYQVYGRRNGQKVYLSTHDSLRAAREADEDDQARANAKLKERVK